jgi:TolB protein
MDFRIFFKLAAFQGFGVGEAWRYHRPAKLPIRPMKTLLLVLTLSAGFAMPCAFAQTPNSAPATPSQPDLATPQEKHLHNVRQLTFGGQNAEAYFSAGGKKLIFQSTRDNLQCDQMFTMNIDGSDVRMVSNGKGKTTCGYFYPDGKTILYSSTYLTDAQCPPRPDYSKGYVWPVYPGFDIFAANPDGSGLMQLTDSPGYDAEATISRNGKHIVFTSLRNGDLDIYVMDADGRHVKQLTHELGYDGGPFFSPDGKHIVYRAYHPVGAKEIAEYKDLLAQNLVRPTSLEIWVMAASGRHKRQVTKLGAASFAPSYFSNGKRIIFSSNLGSTGGMGNFELYAINANGTNLEQITYSPGFDGFPMFSRDGKKLVWASNRNAKAPHETNIFIADWAP